MSGQTWLPASPVWAAWLATAMIAGAMIADLRHDVRRLISARNVVLGGIFIWYLLEALKAGPAVMAYGPAAYEYGIFLVMLGAGSFLVGYHRSDVKCFDGWARRAIRLDDWEFRRNTLWVGACIGLIPIVLFGLNDPVKTVRDVLGSRATWGGALGRGALGDFRAAVLMIETFLLGVAWVAMLVLGDRRRTRGITFAAAAVLAWHLVRSYGTGTRSMIFLSVLVPAAWFYWHADERRQRVLAASAVPCALLFYWFAGAMVQGRNEGRLDFGKAPTYVGHEMFRELLFIVDQVPSKRPYLYGETILIEAINPVPRFLWKDKPLGFGVTYAGWQGYDALAGGPTLSPGILGEMYVNFGLPGIALLSLLGGAICRAWDRIGPRSTDSMSVLMLYSLGLGNFLMMGRSFSITVFYPIFAAFISMALVAWHLRRTSRAFDCRSWQPGSAGVAAGRWRGYGP